MTNLNIRDTITIQEARKILCQFPVAREILLEFPATADENQKREFFDLIAWIHDYTGKILEGSEISEE